MIQRMSLFVITVPLVIHLGEYMFISKIIKVIKVLLILNVLIISNIEIMLHILLIVSKSLHEDSCSVSKYQVS